MREQRSEREGKEQEKLKLQSFKFTVRRRTAPADPKMETNYVIIKNWLQCLATVTG